jgi:carboxyl-terminal processing protease
MTPRARIVPIARKTRGSSSVHRWAVVVLLLGITAGLSSPASAADTMLPEAAKAARARNEVLAMIKESFVDPVDIAKFSQPDLKMLVREIDPEGQYFDAQAFGELLNASEKPADVGLVLRRDGDALRIVDLVAGSPAASAGLTVGDQIIDGVLVKSLPMPDGTIRLRGLPRTSIKLSVLQKGRADPVEITLQREITRPQTVRLRELEPDYVHIHISQFLTGTTADLVAQLNERFRREIPKGLVLDLRNSTGGLLNGAVGIAAVFLPPGALVATFSGQSQNSNFSVHASPQDYLRLESNYMKTLHPDVKKVALVVLVNERTAAGSEIVAAALQDHKRGVVVGTRTFGRATVQTIFPLDGRTALKLTTARWVSPQQRSVHGTGLAPDVVSTHTPAEASQDAPSDDRQLEHALTILKAQVMNKSNRGSD